MELEIYQVDAFCKDIFSGNPAAVCPLNEWLDDSLMQRIAAENNLAETAFYVPRSNHYEIRWFTPTVEVDLCGHATLAAAHVLFNHKEIKSNTIRFFSHRSGELNVLKNEDLLTLDFPVDQFKLVPIRKDMFTWFSVHPIEAYKGKTDYMLVFPSQLHIEKMVPNLAALEKATDARGVIVTAKGTEVDFVSRFFAPQSGIGEDPVTGSAHTTLTPYWAMKLDKRKLSAIQLSARKGFLKCTSIPDRVLIGGHAKTYLIGRIFVS